MARVVRLCGRGGQRFAERVLGWNRGTIRKGQRELERGEAIEDAFHLRGRLRSEEHLPDLLADIRSIMEPAVQADPTLRSARTYSPLSAEEVRGRLIERCGYREKELPCIRTIRNKLNALGYHLRKVRKCVPQKKIPETDAIFEEVHRTNAWAAKNAEVLRISLDTKASVKIGPFSRGGYSRVKERACDHDFKPDETLTPFGILLPKTGKTYLWFTSGKVTADFMVDRMDEMLPKWKQSFGFKVLVINADNGPENSGRRTQWLKRLVELADDHQITVQLAYYPPYHSKYNPIERCWGTLENHWRGQILDTAQKAIGLARTMTFRALRATVRVVRKKYRLGVSLNRAMRKQLEARLQRTKGLEPWAITIEPASQMG